MIPCGSTEAPGPTRGPDRMTRFGAYPSRKERKPDMRKTLVSLFASALAALALASGARADAIPWGYSASDTEIFNSNNAIQTSSIKFTGSSGVANGDSGIIIYNLASTSSADAKSPDSFSSVPYDLAVTLSDIKATSSLSPSAKANDVVKFSGLFSADNVTKSSLLPGNNAWKGSTKADVVLGSDDTGWRKYTVEIASFTPPGQPGGAPGSIQAIVHVTDANAPPPGGGSGNDGGGDPPPAQTPEPASLLLAGLGLPALLLARRRLKKAAAAQDVA